MCPFDKKEATIRPLLLRLVGLGAFHVRKGDEQARADDQCRAKQSSCADRLVEYNGTHYDAGDRLQRAEDGSALAADEEGALLKQHHRTAGYHSGKEQAQQPAFRRGRQSEAVCCKAERQQNDAADCGDIKSKEKAGNFCGREGGQQHHIKSKGDTGAEGQCAACQVQRGARRIKQTDTRHTEQHADETQQPNSLPQQDEAGKHHNSRIYKVQYRCRSGRDVFIGAEQ